jgi:hypothetical protein
MSLMCGVRRIVGNKAEDIPIVRLLLKNDTVFCNFGRSLLGLVPHGQRARMINRRDISDRQHWLSSLERLLRRPVLLEKGTERSLAWTIGSAGGAWCAPHLGHTIGLRARS